MQRCYVVTGAASGIGRSVADRLRTGGAEVIGVDLHDADIVADLASPPGRAALVEQVSAQRTAVDGVVACAGTALAEPIAVSINYFGVIEPLTALIPLLARSETPRVVALTSVSAVHRGIGGVIESCLSGDEQAALEAARVAVERGKGLGIYSATKCALSRWIRRQAVTDDWAGHGIALNGVGPGVVDTPMIREQLADPHQRGQLESAVPMPLRGPMAADDIARLVQWLVEPTNPGVTGQCIYIDGGADAVLRGDTVW